MSAPLPVDGRTVRLERLLPGPIERVWRYLTDEPLLETWLGHALIPSHPGANFRLRFVHDPGEDETDVMHGTTITYDPPRVLEYTWSEPGPDGDDVTSYVRFALSIDGDRVRLVLTHRHLPTGIVVKVRAGWHTHFDVLEGVLTGAPRIRFWSRYGELEAGYRSSAAETNQEKRTARTTR